MKTVCIVVYVVGFFISYVLVRIYNDFDDEDAEIGMAILMALLWPAVVPFILCAWVIIMIGKLLDRAAFAVRDAILKKKGR